MDQATEKKVREWLTMIKIATDEDSPFAGMIDLTSIFKLPRTTQKIIYDALPEDTKARLKELYGNKEAVE